MYIGIKSLLRKLERMVSIGCSKSQELDITSGVPQGTVLHVGQLLLIIRLSDINTRLQSASVRSFFDDLRLLKKLVTQNLRDYE